MASPAGRKNTHTVYRAPTEDDYITFAREFWDNWEEGEGRNNWCDRAAIQFGQRFPAAHLAAAFNYFVSYWDANINREPSLSEYKDFAREFWNNWNEGEERDSWARRAAVAFRTAYPNSSPVASFVFFRKYWDTNAVDEGVEEDACEHGCECDAESETASEGEEEQLDGTMVEDWMKNTIRLYHREVDRWWSAFCDEIRDEGVTNTQKIAEQAFERFTQHFHRILWHDCGSLKSNAEDKMWMTRKALGLCQERYKRCVV